MVTVRKTLISWIYAGVPSFLGLGLKEILHGLLLCTILPTKYYYTARIPRLLVQICLVKSRPSSIINHKTSWDVGWDQTVPLTTKTIFFCRLPIIPI